jgi:hypothetical protein
VTADRSHAAFVRIASRPHVVPDEFRVPWEGDQDASFHSPRSFGRRGVVGSAQADILWNQLPAYDNFTLPAFPDFVGGTSAAFAVSDVSVPASGWTINSVSTYFSDLSFNPTVTTAVLNIFPRAAASRPRAMTRARPRPVRARSLFPLMCGARAVHPSSL